MEGFKTHPMSSINTGSKLNKQRGTWYKKKIIMITILIVMVIMSAILYKVIHYWWANKSINSKQYQALFLTNGQVYFGKLSDISGQYVKLKDIYYLQSQQQSQGSASNTNNTTTQQSQFSLVKLGNELHSPENAMYIARNQILFWENLKADGKVTKAINDSQSNNKK